jgi:hypothetical protein
MKFQLAIISELAVPLALAIMLSGKIAPALVDAVSGIPPHKQ